jgi:hypothetical protein
MPCLTKLMKLHRLLTLKIVELLVQDKAKLLEFVAKDYDRFGPWHMELAYAAEEP